MFDVDRHKRHNVIGHALYPLRDHDCESNERLVIWRDLEREVSEVRLSVDVVPFVLNQSGIVVAYSSISHLVFDIERLVSLEVLIRVKHKSPYNT